MIEVIPEPAYRVTPFDAQIASEVGEEQLGRIRITPPCTLSEHYLEEIRASADVKVRHEFTIKQASIFSFQAEEPPTRPGFSGYEERVVHTVNEILKDLGCAAYKALFEAHYPLPKEQGEANA